MELAVRYATHPDELKHYSFIWNLLGENPAFDDRDHVAPAELR